MMKTVFKSGDFSHAHDEPEKPPGTPCTYCGAQDLSAPGACPGRVARVFTELIERLELAGAFKI